MIRKGLIMIWLLLSIFSISVLYSESDPLDWTNQGYEQYQDIYVQGTVIGKASYGERYLEERFERVNRIFSRYKRPFTVLDVGAAQGYFSFRGAEIYPESVFVMLEGSNSVYPVISKQLASICELNSIFSNIIWLDRPIIVGELQQLSFCEHVDVVLLLNILHWFPENWQTLLESMQRMSHVTIIELPPLEEELPPAHRELRVKIHSYLSKVADEIWEGVPRHTNPSVKTIYYILENKEPFHFQTTSIVHTPKQDRKHCLYFDYDSKILIKQDLSAPAARIENKWLPGINLITYLAVNGAVPLRKEVVDLIPINTHHRDWMPNNMVVQGKKIVLIDTDDPKNEPGESGGYTLYSPKIKSGLEDLILNTVNASPEQFKEAFYHFCKNI